MREIDADSLRSIPLFGQVDDRHLPRLVQAASIREFPAQTLLFSEGERPQALYGLIAGSVELFSGRHDRRCTVSIIRSAKAFVICAVVRDSHAMSARTLEASRLVMVPAGLIRELFDADPGFLREAARQLAGDHLSVIEDLKSLRLRTSIERLAEWMLRCDAQAGGSGRFAIPYDKRTLAAYLGMAPENLSRNLATLASAGVVVRGRRIVINDPKALAAIAGSGCPADG